MTRNASDHYADEPHDVSRALPHHYVPYMTIFICLVVLTIITVGIGIAVRFPNEVFNVLLALAIAAVKASLVALFFMHLKFEGKLIYIIFLVPLGLCILLIVALLPDVVMTGPSSSSLHPFNTPAMMQPEHEH